MPRTFEMTPAGKQFMARQRTVGLRCYVWLSSRDAYAVTFGDGTRMELSGDDWRGLVEARVPVRWRGRPVDRAGAAA